MCHASKERERMFGTRSADYIRASSHNGCIARPNTWLHPNASLICPIFSCTAGAVHTWHIASFAALRYVRSLLGELQITGAYRLHL
jgi:hypothetical protein